MFTQSVSLMLYVDDVLKEKVFWQAIGFEITNENCLMGYETFDMKQHPESTVTLTVFSKEFIQKVSPEVLHHVPSVLFETSDIYRLQQLVAQHTETASQVNTEPFLNFNFASPSGIYFAVKQK